MTRSLCGGRAIIQALFACAEPERAAEVSGGYPVSSGLACDETGTHNGLLGRAEGCAEVVMTLRVPISSSFVEERDESSFYLRNTDSTKALSRQWRGKNSCDLFFSCSLFPAHQCAGS